MSQIFPVNDRPIAQQTTNALLLLTDGIGKQTWPAFGKLNGDWDFPGRPDSFPNPAATGLPLQFIPHWSFP